MGAATTLSGLDATLLRIESPRTPMHIASVGIFEGPPLLDDAGLLRIDDIRARISGMSVGASRVQLGSPRVGRRGPGISGRRRRFRARGGEPAIPETSWDVHKHDSLHAHHSWEGDYRGRVGVKGGLSDAR